MIESEKILEKQLVKRIKGLGGMCIKLSSPHFTGLPDRLCLLPSKNMFFVEVKTTGKKPTARQELVHRDIKALGFLVTVIDNSEQLEQLIDIVK